jgi:hypothetical protein
VSTECSAGSNDHFVVVLFLVFSVDRIVRKGSKNIRHLRDAWLYGTPRWVLAQTRQEACDRLETTAMRPSGTREKQTNKYLDATIKDPNKIVGPIIQEIVNITDAQKWGLLISSDSNAHSFLWGSRDQNPRAGRPGRELPGSQQPLYQKHRQYPNVGHKLVRFSN